MHFVGIDLAWGDRGPTGLAVTDEDGRLEQLAVARDDTDILAQLETYVRGDCVVAIDGPLAVVNAHGSRTCEKQLNHDFRMFDAGAYPSNTGLPWFADGGRGARLCRAMDLDLANSSRRRAIEVYPHAASIVLFGLSKTLKYKQKPGRDVGQLRTELLRLISFVEGLRAATPSTSVGDHDGWQRLKQSVQAATRKSELRRAEDPVDAVVCAHVARYATLSPDDVTVYGDVTTGCIVTPRLGATPKSTKCSDPLDLSRPNVGLGELEITPGSDAHR